MFDTKRLVMEFPDAYDLITDRQDIEAVLDHIGKSDYLDDVGALFVCVGDGDYTAVYYTESSVPHDGSFAFRLL